MSILELHGTLISYSIFDPLPLVACRYHDLQGLADLRGAGLARG